MIASNRWTELLTCSNCGMSGSARLSRLEKRAHDFSMEAIPAAFKIVRLEFGETFYCRACNCPADTKQPALFAGSVAIQTIGKSSTKYAVVAGFHAVTSGRIRLCVPKT